MANIIRNKITFLDGDYSKFIKHLEKNIRSSHMERINDFTFIFDTNWFHCDNIVHFINKCLGGKLLYEFAEEHIGCQTGFVLFENGVKVRDVKYPDGSLSAYEMGFKIFPHRRDLYVQKNGIYRFKEE